MWRLIRLGAVLFVLGLFGPGAAFAANQTVVSLTFDDGIASQFTTRAMLAAHGMHATFYVNTNTLGQFDRMTWSDLATLNADGHEIAGHTLDHVNLPALAATNPTEARRQVCEDRGNLVNHGFVAKSFAYPGGEFDGRSEAIVRDCGYASGRLASGLRRIVNNPYPFRSYTSPIPPPDPYAISIPCCTDSTITLGDLENYISASENAGGGWVILLFHSICDGCANNAVSPTILAGLLDWLQPRAALGTVVKTVTQVISVDEATPLSTAACNGTACSAGWYTAAASVSLSAIDTGSGVAQIRYTLDGSEPTVSSPTYTAPLTVSETTTVKFRAWDNAGNVEATKTQLVAVDTAAPSSTIACDGSACLDQAYTGAVSVTLAATDGAGGSGIAAIRYTNDGSTPTTASALYSGPFTISETTTVKFRAWDNAGNVEASRSQLIQIVLPPPADTQPPTSAIACNGSTCSTGWYAGAVNVTLSATDDQSGVAAIRYTLDGSDPTVSSIAYTGAFVVSSTTTVKFHAWDNAGNVEASRSQLIQIVLPPPADTQPPTSAIACNGSTCSTGWYAGAVNVTLSATDDQSGVAAIRYTVDGSDPTVSSIAYTGAFVVSSTTTVKFRAWDNAGNVEATKTQLIQVDTEAPAVAITSPTSGSSVKGNVKIIVNASDPLSGVVSVSFYANGVLIGTKVGSPFFVNWQTNKLRGTYTLTAVAVDAAGNSRVSAPITVSAG